MSLKLRFYYTRQAEKTALKSGLNESDAGGCVEPALRLIAGGNGSSCGSSWLSRLPKDGGPCSSWSMQLSPTPLLTRFKRTVGNELLLTLPLYFSFSLPN